MVDSYLNLLVQFSKDALKEKACGGMKYDGYKLISPCRTCNAYKSDINGEGMEGCVFEEIIYIIESAS